MATIGLVYSLLVDGEDWLGLFPFGLFPLGLFPLGLSPLGLFPLYTPIYSKIFNSMLVLDD